MMIGCLVQILETNSFTNFKDIAAPDPDEELEKIIDETDDTNEPPQKVEK